MPTYKTNLPLDITYEFEAEEKGDRDYPGSQAFCRIVRMKMSDGRELDDVDVPPEFLDELERELLDVELRVGIRSYRDD